MAVGDMGSLDFAATFSSALRRATSPSREVARRSRDGEVAANLRQPLSQPVAASSPERGALMVRSVGAARTKTPAR